MHESPIIAVECRPVAEGMALIKWPICWVDSGQPRTEDGWKMKSISDCARLSEPTRFNLFVCSLMIELPGMAHAQFDIDSWLSNLLTYWSLSTCFTRSLTAEEGCWRTSWVPMVNSHSTSRTILSPLGINSSQIYSHYHSGKGGQSLPSQNKTHLPEINKPQARISGVEVSMCYPTESNTCIEVTSGQLHSCTDCCRTRV
jgi:hypothetical protein